jgi:hypothetical protein
MRTRREICAYALLTLLAPLLAWLGPTIVRASHGVAHAAVARCFVGAWQGQLERQSLVVAIERNADGSLAGKLTTLSQGSIPVPIDSILIGAEIRLHMELKSIGAVYEGRLSGNASEITGSWQQDGNSLPLVLRRMNAAQAAFTLMGVSNPPRLPTANLSQPGRRHENFGAAGE